MGIISAINTKNGDLFILDGAGGEVLDGSITTDKIADGAVTDEKIADTVFAVKNYLKDGTIINVASSGGDFTTLESALDFIKGKWSDGAVTILLANETFTMTSPYVIRQIQFNIPDLVISGTDTTKIINNIADTNATALSLSRAGNYLVKKIEFVNGTVLNFSAGTNGVVENCTFRQCNLAIGLWGRVTVDVKNSTFDTCQTPVNAVNNSTLFVNNCNTINCTKQGEAYSSSFILFASSTLNNATFVPALHTLSADGSYIQKY